MSRWRAPGMRITHRVVGLFVACALLPVVVTLALSYGRVHEALLSQRIGYLREAAGAYGTSLIERLSVAEPLIPAIAGETASLDQNESVRRHFRTAVLAERGRERVVFGDPARLPRMDQNEALKARLAAVETTLFVSRRKNDPGSVWLVRGLPPNPGAASIALELDPGFLWGLDENLPYATDVCVLDHQGEPLHCSRPLPAAGLDAIRARLATDFKGDIGWEAEGIRYVSGFRELFLKGRFGAPAWYVVASQSEEYALAPVQSIKQLVIPAVVLGVLLAAFLGLVQVRRTLRPLEELTHATARIAARDFAARVPVQRDDEFGALAAAFNAMSGRLGRQFHALEAHAQIDALILSSVDVARVAAIVLERLKQVARADRYGLLIADPAGAGYCLQTADGAGPRSIVVPEDAAARLLTGGLFAAHAGDALDLGARAVQALPIAIGGELAGAVLLGYDDERRPDDEEIAHARELADRVAVALATARRDLELHRRAHYDSLTQLPNRLLGLEELNRAVAAAERRKGALAVLFVDLDGFSAVNDTFGHISGDELLTQAAARLRQCVRKSDIVSRLGGDEFAIVLPEIRGPEDAAVVATHAIEALSRAFEIQPSPAFISASIGIALFPSDGTSAEELLRHADLAMYRAKAQRDGAQRGQPVFFEASMNAEVQRRMTLERELREALKGEQFELYYQPQLDVASGRITGAEALIRWHHPARGFVPPGQFIGFAEGSALIEDIGRWALQTASRQFMAWRAAGLPLEHVSVNVAPRQFHNPAFARDVEEALRDSGIEARSLRLEITETAVIDHEGAAEANLAALSALGTPLELDDFGTGYSSLACLQRLPVATVKLDLELIRGIQDSANNRAVVRAAIDMAHALGKTVVAEGVEHAGQLAILAELGCDSIQGYHLSPPAPAAKFVQFVRSRSAELPSAA